LPTRIFLHDPSIPEPRPSHTGIEGYMQRVCAATAARLPFH
jgi:hypothetical protein